MAAAVERDRRQPGTLLRGRATSRSCSPQASVTGTRICSTPRRPRRAWRWLAPSKPGEVTYERTSRAAAGGGTRSGRATEPRSSRRRPRALRSSAGSSGQQRAAEPADVAARPRAERLLPEPRGAEPGHRQRTAGLGQLERHPAAERVAGHVHADPGRARRGRPPPRRRAPAAWAERRWRAGGEAPKPGRSIAITSRSRARRSSTGSQTTSSAPSGWISTSGSPCPRRTWFSTVFSLPPERRGSGTGQPSGSPARPARPARRRSAARGSRPRSRRGTAPTGA